MDDAIALAEAGDAGALRMIADVGEYGGRGLAMIGTMLNPPLIIIGGKDQSLTVKVSGSELRQNVDFQIVDF